MILWIIQRRENEVDKRKFLDELANILDADTVNDSDNLRDFDSWDSLSVLSIVAMADSKFGFTLTFPEIKGLTTVADLWAHFEKNRGR